MRNIKKVAALLLAVCLLLTGIPYTANAESYSEFPTYNFGDLYSAVSAYGCAASNEDGDYSIADKNVQAFQQSLYDNRLTDMTFAESTNSFLGKYAKSNVFTYTNVGTYIAFRIRVPANTCGEYAVKLGHYVSGRGGIVSMHILPASESSEGTSIQSKLSSQNRVGVIDFNGGNGNPAYYAEENMLNGSIERTDTVGFWSFDTKQEEDYLVVFNMIEASPYYKNQCYTFLNSLSFTARTASDEITVSERTNPLLISGNAVENFETVVYAAVGKVTEDGRERYNLYLPIEGDRLNVYDLEKMEKIEQVIIPFDVCRGITVDDEGIVWMVGSAPCVFKYDPNTGTTTEYGSYKSICGIPANSGFYLYNDGDYLYFGTSEDGYVIRFNKTDGTYTAYNYGAKTTIKKNGIPDAGAYSCGVSVKDGILYCGFAGDLDKDKTETYEILKIRLEDSTLLGSVDFTHMFRKSEVMFRGLGVTKDGILFAAASGCYGMLCVDTADSMTVFNPTDKNGKPVYNKINYDVTQVGDVTYLCLGSTGKDVITGTVYGAGDADLMTPGLYKWVVDSSYPHGGYLEYVCGFNQALNCGQDSFAVINGKRCIVAKGYDKKQDKNYITYCDLDTGLYDTIYDLINEEEDGAPISLQPLSTDKDGKLYMGTFNTSKCSIYDPDSESFIGSFLTSGQTDALLWHEYNGEYNLYAGNYNTGRLTKVNMTDKDGNNEYMLGFKAFDNYTTELTAVEQTRLKDLHQSRVHTIAAGGDKLFIGSIPDQYEFGGALGWYDLKNNTTFATRGADVDGDGQGDGVIYHQSIIKLVYMQYNGLPYLMGITSIEGGTGSQKQTASNTLRAQLFVYDVTNNCVQWQTDLVAELAEKGYALCNQNALTALEADPNGNGFWCIASDCVFNFTYTGNGIKINALAEFSSSRGKNGQYVHGGHRANDLVFDDTYIYMPVCDYVGVLQINRAKFLEGTLESTRLPVPVTSFYAIGSDRNLYYTQYEKLYMYPLHVTSDNIADAKAVDQAIFKLGTITVDSAEAIATCQNAYDDLSNEAKAIVKNLYLLEEAQIDLLKARIDAIGTDYAQNAQTIRELMEQYKALPSNKRAMVTNYSTLQHAFESVDDYYQVGEETFNTFEEAFEAAKAAETKTIKLLQNDAMTELLLTDGITLDLNGHTLTLNAFRAGMPDLGDGFVVDSSTGNNGLLRLGRAEELFEIMASNPDLPIYDTSSSGYRFFDYKLVRDELTENVGVGREKFWFYFHFYTDDTCKVQDMDAYKLMQADGSNMQIGVDISWRESFVSTVVFGLADENGELQTDLFSEKWAQDATLKRWLYVVVSGLDKIGCGTLEVKPVIAVNGVEVTCDSIDYTIEMEEPDYGWSERPS